LTKRGSFVTFAESLLALSPASVIRTCLGGFAEGKQSLRDTYHAVAPFSPVQQREGRMLEARIPAVELRDAVALPEGMIVDLRYIEMEGAAPFVDVAAILALAIAQQPLGVLEIGTFWGSTTANLARNLPAAKIHTIDLPLDEGEVMESIAGQPVNDLHLIQSRQVGKAFRGTDVEDRITQHFGDTAKFDYSIIADPLSFFMIDGSHTYEYAKSDTLVCLALAKGPSTLVWHDCNQWQPGVTKWLVEMIDVGLPVKRVTRSAVAYLQIDPSDETVQRLLARQG
jgi:hypothetical protein